VNIRDIHCSGHASAAFSKRVIDALGQLQPQTNSSTPSRVYIYDLIDQHTLYANCSVAELLGYPAPETQTAEPIQLASLIHSDDLERVAEHYQRFSTLRPGEVITVDYRMKRADGTWRWFHAQETTLLHANDGFPLQILGMLQDLSSLSITNFTRSLANQLEQVLQVQ
jgi:PAS domain S-box-containing protein